MSETLQEQPYSWEELQRAHAIAGAHDPFFAGMTLPEFSKHMAQTTGSTRYKLGQVGPIGEFAHNVNAGIEDLLAPLKETGAETGLQLGSLIGPKTGRTFEKVGEGIPRLGADVAAMAAGGPVGVGAALADVGLGTYGQTGSLPAAAAQAGAFAATPLAGGLGSKLATRVSEPLGASLESLLGPTVARIGEVGTEKAGSFLGMAAAQEAGGEASSLLSGQGLYNPLEPERLGQTLAGFLPFAPLEIPSALRGYRTGINPRGENVPVPAPLFGAKVPGQARSLAEFARQSPVNEQAAKAFKDALMEAQIEKEAKVTTLARDPSEGAGVFDVLNNPRPEPQPLTPVSIKETLPAQALQGGVFGSSIVSELNTEKPFKLTVQPGDFLPGNSLYEAIKSHARKSGEFASELEGYEQAGLKEFLKGRRVSRPELEKWLVENGPRVEVKVAGESQVPEATRIEKAQLEHKLDTLLPNWRQMEVEQIDDQSKEITDAYYRWQDLGAYSGIGGANWQSISPKPESQMPGYAEISVGVPLKNLTGTSKEGTTIENFRQRAGELFPSTHSFPPNTLGWSRGYMETLPNGEKVWHVVEVQSDWAQQVREREAQLKKRADLREEGLHVGPTHPLLKDWERLVLKATIKHAIDQGADRIAVSDAETAMMTEGHDTQPGVFPLLEPQTHEEATQQANEDFGPGNYTLVLEGDGWRVHLKEPDISQAKGMRLHYDQLIPKILGELTGAKGEKVGLGEHKMAFEPNRYDNAGGLVADMTKLRQNLIFKNEKGEPKTDVTATSFPLEKAAKNLAKEGGYTFYGKGKLSPDTQERLRTMETQGASPEQLAIAIQQRGQVKQRKGETLTQAIAREVGLDQAAIAGNPPELLQATHDFFTKYWEAQGEQPARVEYLTNKMMQIASQYVGKVPALRFLELIERGGGGAALQPITTKGVETPALLAIRGFPNKEAAERSFQVGYVLAHELMHHVVQFGQETGVDPQLAEAVKGAMASSENLSPLDKENVMRAMLTAVLPPGKRQIIGEFNKQMSRYSDPSIGDEEFIADYAGLMSLGITSGNKKAYEHLQDLVKYGSKETTDFSYGMYRELSRIYGALKEFLSAVFDVRKESPGEAQRILAEVKSIEDNLNKILGTKEDADAALAAFNAAMERQTIGPINDPPKVTMRQLQAFVDKVNSLPALKRSDVGDELNKASEDIEKKAMPPFGDRPGAWEKFWKPMGQFVKDHPVFKQVFDLAFNYHEVATQLTLNLWKNFEAVNGKFDSARLRKVIRVDGPLMKPISDILRAQRTDEKVYTTKEEKEKASPEYAKLTPDQKKEVDKTLADFAQMARKAEIIMVRANRESDTLAVARIIQGRDKTMYADQAEDIARKIVSHVYDAGKLGLQDEAQLELFVNQGLAQEDKGFRQGLALAQELFQSHQEFRKQIEGEDLQGRPYYSPEVRHGKWQIAWKDKGGQRHLWDFESKNAAEQKYAELLPKKDSFDYLKAYNADDKKGAYGSPMTDQVETFTKAEQDRWDKILAVASQSGYDPDTIQHLAEEYKPGEATSLFQASPYLQQYTKGGIEGRERLNMVQGWVNYINSLAYTLPKRYVRQKSNLVINNPDMRANPALQTAGRTYMDYILNPRGKEFTFLKNLAVFNMVTSNPSTALIEPTQLFIAHVPYLLREGSGIGQAYRLVAKGMQVAGKYALTGKFDNADHARLIREAEQGGWVSTGILQDVYSVEHDLEELNTRNILTGTEGAAMKTKDLVAKPLYALMKLGKAMYGIATKFDSRAAAISAFDYAKEKGMDYDKAKEFARVATITSMAGGGRISRPLWYSGLGKASGVGGLMYLLNGYSSNMVAMMARFGREAIGNSNMSLEEKSAARKAFGTMMATQLAVGGVMGLPFAAAGVSLLEQFFDKAEIKKGIRESLTKAFTSLAGQDEEMGHTMADGAMGGVMNLGIGDFGYRFQLGNLFGVDPYKGFSWRNVAGPAGSMIENYVNGARQIVNGEPGQGIGKLLPQGAKGLYKLYNDGGVLRDPQDKLLLEPTAAEKTLLALGFKPKRLNETYEQQQMQLRSEKIVSDQLQQFHRDVAKDLLAGNIAKVRGDLLNMQKETPNYSAVAGLKRVVEIAQDMTIPKDLTRGTPRVGAQQTAEIAGLFGQQRPQLSEVQRLLQASKMEQVVGFPGSGRISPIQIRTAHLIDQLMAANPKLTRTQALVLIERQLHPQAAYRQYGPLPGQ